MYFNLLNLQFWMYLILFFPAIFISFYIPGSIFFSKLKIKSLAVKFVLSNAFGVSLWGMQGYIFGYLNIRFMSYLYCGISLLYFICHFKNYKKELISLFNSLLKKNIIMSALIVVGSIFQLTPIFFSGLKYQDGIKFFGNNAVDGVMHIAYIQSIVNYFPPQEPGLAGVLIRNYHYWTDMVLADLARVWGLPIIHLFFQFIPIYLSILIGFTAFLVVREWGGSKKMAFWFLFLLYFASDAAYLVMLVLHKILGLYTPAIDSGVLQFLNMPHMFGKFLFLGGLITFQKWIKEKDIRWGIVTMVLVASLFGFKIYFGLFAAIGLVFYFLGKFIFETFKEKKIIFDLNFLLLLVFFFVVSAVIFLPHNLGAGGFVFVYLEWPRSLLGVGSIDWRDWWLRRQVYEQAHNIKNLFVLDFLAVLIAFISIYGTRLLGFFVTPKLLKFLGYEKVLFLIPSLIVFHLLGLFTIQSSGGVNVYNFFSVSALILSLFTAFILSKVRLNLFGIIVIGLFITLTIPRSAFEIIKNMSSYNSSDFRLISNDELQAFGYISSNSSKNSVIQASPVNSLDLETPYVSFFTDRSSFIAGSGLLSTRNIKVVDDKNNLEKIFQSTEIVDFVTKVKQKHISYLYLQKNPEQELKFKVDSAYLKKVFENKTTFVLQVQ